MALIDREALLEVPNVRKVTEYDEAGFRMTYLAVPLDAIEDAPAVDAEPVRRGEWVLIETSLGLKTYRCNQNGCKDSPFWKERYCYGTENFCPNCGAKMKEGSV